MRTENCQSCQASERLIKLLQVFRQGRGMRADLIEPSSYSLLLQFCPGATPAKEATHQVSGQAGQGRAREGAQGQKEGEEEQQAPGDL